MAAGDTGNVTGREPAPLAKLVGGVWLPVSDTSFERWMLAGKGMQVVQGKHTYQYSKIAEALEHQPADRRHVAIDIGAHVGLWSMWLAQAFDWVEAFEPIPLLADILPFNIHRGHVNLHRTALGREAGTVSMAFPLDFTGSGRVDTDRPHPGLAKYELSGETKTYPDIPMRALDDFGYKIVDFIKIDVEGYESRVVAGAERTIRDCRPNVIIEQKGCETAYGDEPGAAKRLLESWGMVPITNFGKGDGAGANLCDWLLGWG